MSKKVTGKKKAKPAARGKPSGKPVKTKVAKSKGAKPKPKVVAKKKPKKPGEGARAIKANPAFIVRRSIISAKPKASIRNDQIFIEDSLTGEITTESLPYTLQDNDIIHTYAPGVDPADPATEPDVETFTVDYVDEDGNLTPDVVEYDYPNDILEIDLSILDQFEEYYDPAADPCYQCEDANGDPVGIEG